MTLTLSRYNQAVAMFALLCIDTGDYINGEKFLKTAIQKLEADHRAYQLITLYLQYLTW
jgi:hypothetical protein